MPTTVAQIIQRAIATSDLNDDDSAQALELLQLVNEKLAYYKARGARLNQALFAERLVVAKVGEGWPRPVRAEIVLQLEASDDTVDETAAAIAEATEIVELPYNQRDTEQGRPAVYDLGQVWYRAGRTGDPSAGGLVVLAATSDDDLADVDDELPSTWPAKAGDPLLKWCCAIYLAQKDGERENEVAAFQAQLLAAESRFDGFCESASIATVRTRGHGTRFATNKITPAG